MSEIIAPLQKILEKQMVVYVTRDIERALGIEPIGNYFIISNDTEYGQEILKRYPNNVWLVKNEKQLDTFDLLSDEKVKESITKYKIKVLVFQNTSRIEEFTKENGWALLNPSAALAKKVEEKMSQYEWLGDLQKYLPPTEIKTVSEIKFTGKPIVVQFNHAHTGQGTQVVRHPDTLENLKRDFPNRPARVSAFVDGPVFTLNAVVTGEGTACGNISYQITGLSDFTDLPFSTIGNDWSLPYKILSEKERGEMVAIASAIGDKLQKEKWRGLFGIDLIYDTKNKKIFLLEINARQPASTTCESIVQKLSGKDTTMFEAHIASLLGEKTDTIQKITDGAQIIVRIKADTNLPKNAVSRLVSGGFPVIRYENHTPNKELLRIRSDKGIMESHEKLNTVGETITSFIS